MRPDTQSPWFWFLLFGGMALLGVAVIGPKHVEREQRRLRMQAAREIGPSGGSATAPETNEAEPIEQTPPPSVQPLMAFLAVLLLAGAAFAQWRARRAPSAVTPPGESSP